MKMYKVTEAQASALRDPDTRFNGGYFNPVKDINGEWFISEKEANYCILHFSFDPVEAEFIPTEPDPID
jgi:hypothetical protein